MGPCAKDKKSSYETVTQKYEYERDPKLLCIK